MKHIIPLSQLLTFKNVYREDSDWHALVTEFRRSPTDWFAIEQLGAELQHARFFREPIWVGYPDEEDRTERWVFDGTHRACAYLLAGVSEVEVEFEGEVESEYIEPTVFVETRLRALDDYEPAVEGDHDAGTVGLWESLLSLRLDENAWLTSDASFTEGELKQVTVAWDSSAPKVSTEIINERVREQLAHFGFDVARLSIETVRRTDADND